MSLTLQARLDKVEALARVYHHTILLSDQLVIKNVERARDEVFRRFLNTNEYLFRTEVVLDSGDPLPDDYVIAANQAYTDVSGVITLISLIEPEEIPEANVSPLIKGTTTHPVWYISNQSVFSIPALTDIHVQYYARPTLLLTDPIDLTLTDSMPQDMEDAIARGAYERCLQMTLSEGDAQQYTEAQLQQASSSLAAFYRDYFGEQTQSTQTR